MMRIVTSRISHLVLGLGLLVGLCFLLAGCGREPVQRLVKDGITKDGPRTNGGVGKDVFQWFAELARYPENPRVGDDWTRLRGGFTKLDDHFPKEPSRLRLTPEQRAFLVKEANLTDAEQSEVESFAFRTADAHYLDECFLLRAAARACEVPQLAALEQTKVLFDWTMRNVILHEQVDTWIPPATVFRLGHASAVDRALAFLALLRQGRSEGCLIVVPGTEPLQFLIGVHDTKDKSLRLFDPRLGLPVRGKDGKSIATLQEVRAEPTLLTSSGIAKEQAEKFEAWLACPLQALAPRMLELQNGLSRVEPIVLHLAADTLHRHISEVARIPVKVWNAKADATDKLPPNSPTRALRLFLPKQDGGIDETNPSRALMIDESRKPMANVFANFGLLPRFDALPKPTRFRFGDVANMLFLNYETQTRELFLRGQFSALSARQDRLFDFARNERLAGLGRDEAFQKEFVKWVTELNAERAKRGEARGDQMLQLIWAQDEQIVLLTDVDRAIRIDPDSGKPIPVKATILTQVLAVGVRDYFHNELARSQAAVAQEKAEHLQAKLGVGKSGAAARQRTDDAWSLAASAWGNFYVERISLDTLIAERVDLMRRQNPAQALFMLETLHFDVHKYFDARLRCAECLTHVDGDGVKKARDYLERTQVELAELQKTGVLAAEIKKITGNLPADRPSFLQKRLDLLANDWADNGSYAWLKRHIDERLKSL